MDTLLQIMENSSPSSASWPDVSSSPIDDAFLQSVPLPPIVTIPTERVVQRPLDMFDVTQKTLNALRTVLPTTAQWVLGAAVVDVVLLDVFLCNDIVKMMIMIVESGEITDTSCFHFDMLHLTHKCCNLLGDLHTTAAATALAIFELHTQNPLYYFMFSDYSAGNVWVPLWTILPPSFNHDDVALHQWFAKMETRKMLPLPAELVFFSQTHITGLNGHPSLCVPGSSQCQTECVCRLAITDASQDTEAWSANQLAGYIVSTVDASVKKFITPTIRKICQAIQMNSSRVQVAPPAVPPAQVPEVVVPILPARSSATNTLHKCSLGRLCQMPARAYWVKCCHFDEPIACSMHMRKYMNRHANQCCPVHHIRSKVAMLVKFSDKKKKKRKKRSRKMRDSKRSFDETDDSLSPVSTETT